MLSSSTHGAVITSNRSVVVRSSSMVTNDRTVHFLFIFFLFVVFSADLGGLPVVTARIPTAQMSPRVITTAQGKLRGILIGRPGRQLPPVEAYLGLQYASTLGADLRFMPPTSSMEKWEGIRVALKFRPVCPQPIPDVEELSKRMPRGRVDHFRRLIPFIEKQKQHEECLYLNIYTPVKDFNSSASPSPVVVFVHGESYDIGTGNAYDGSMLAAYGSLVVVTINYRLGVLGFLSTGDSNAPGNYGLLDQIAALHWIKENVGSFGGDPTDVTLLGHGYGASLVNLLMVSPITKDGALFRRVILHSGTALSTWSMVEQPMHFARRLAQLVNCTGFGGSGGDASSRDGHYGTATPTSQTTPTTPADGGDSSIAIRRMLGCLKRLPVEQLLSAARHVSAPRFFTSFGPTVDGRSVLPHDIRRLTSDISDETGFGRVDLLVGVMKNEGFAYFNQTDVDGGLDTDRMRRIIRTYVRNVYRYQRQYIYDVILYQYQQDSDRRHVQQTAASSSATAGSTTSKDPEAIRDLVMELIGDAQQAAPAVDLARRHAAASTTAALTVSTPATDYFGNALSPPLGASGSRRRAQFASPVSAYTSSVPASTYLYVFGHQTRIDTYPRWADGVHADDIAYVFGAPLAAGPEPGSTASEIDPFPTVYSRPDRTLSETVMRYWSNFIRSGNPNVAEKTNSQSHSETDTDVISSNVKRDVIYWPRYHADTQQYLQLGLEPSVRHHYRAEKMALWLGLVPRLHRSTGPAAATGSMEIVASRIIDDDRYHQLDDEDNFNSFEDDNDVNQKEHQRMISGHKSEDVGGNNGSHLLNDKASAKKYVVADLSELSPDVVGPITSPGRKSTKRSTAVVPTRHVATTPDVLAAASMDSRSVMTSSQVQHRQPNNEESAAGFGQPPQQHIALLATIATGCGALLLNCAVFAAVCVHRARISRRSKSLPLPATIGYGVPSTSSTASRTFASSSCRTASNTMRPNCSVPPYNCSTSSLQPMRNHRNGTPTSGGYSIDVNRLAPITSSPSLEVGAPTSSSALQRTTSRGHPETSPSPSPASSWPPPLGTASTLPPPPPPQRTSASTLMSTSSTADRRSTATEKENDVNYCDRDSQNHRHRHQLQLQQHHDYTITSLT